MKNIKYVSLLLLSLVACGPQELRLDGDLNKDNTLVDAKVYRRVQTPEEINKQEQWLKDAHLVNKINRQKLKDLAQKFAPVLYEHSDEKFPLINVDTYIKQVGLAFYHHDGHREVLLKPGEVSLESLYQVTVPN